MECISGKGIFQGIAVGRIAIYHKAKQKIRKSQVTDPVGEWQRYLEVRKQVLTTLDELAGKARSRAGEKDARIFDAQGMLLMDEYYNQYVRDRIMVDGVNAEYAIAETRDHFAGVFEQMDCSAQEEKISGMFLSRYWQGFWADVPQKPLQSR